MVVLARLWCCQRISNLFMKTILLPSSILLGSIAFADVIQVPSGSTPMPTTQGPPEEQIPTATERSKWPHFHRPAFDYHFAPLASYRLTNTGTIAELASSSGQELGLLASLRNIGFRRKNHSLLSLSLSLAAAEGRIKTLLVEKEGRGSSSNSLGFFRGYAETQLSFYYKSFRILANVSRGGLSYRLEEVPLIQAIVAKGTTGLRVYNWMGLHFDTIYRHIYSEVFSDPTSVELISWPHSEFNLKKLGIDLDIGPGLAYAQESRESKISGEGSVRFAFMTLNLKKFFNIDIEGRARYILKNSNDELGYYATMKLPQDSMYEPPLLVAPSDTLTLSLFVNQFYRDFKIGYWNNWLVYDYQRKYRKKSHTNRESGFGVFVGYEL